MLTRGAGGAAHGAYFARLQAALVAAGIAWPCVVVDAARLDRNAARLRRLVAPRLALRLVEKSLPVPALLERAMAALGTERLMVFHLPQLLQVARRFPDANVLLGKPLPVAAARHFYATLGATPFAPARQLQWLVDTPARLEQYAALAAALGTTLQVNIEIDVGLHRGGVADAATLRAMLARITAPGSRLRFAGLMGYDAHVGKLPALVQRRATSFRRATATYRAFQAVVREVDPQLAEGACWNGGGSPTVALHGADSPLGEVAVGSALLKPAAFDTPLLADFEPAVFIATPVLKALAGTRLPGPAWLSRLLYAGRASRARSYFVYGGGWPARPASPPGLRANTAFGLSFNQEIWNGPATPALAADDCIFLRPLQSEGTLLHFGPVQVFDGTRITTTWAPFTEDAT